VAALLAQQFRHIRVTAVYRREHWGIKKECVFMILVSLSFPRKGGQGAENLSTLSGKAHMIHFDLTLRSQKFRVEKKAANSFLRVIYCSRYAFGRTVYQNARWRLFDSSRIRNHNVTCKSEKRD
jgi:hypothetical protein